MKFTFDLISDLHIDTWDHELDLQGFATSPFCVVAGDVGRDIEQVHDFLNKLCREYQAVFYIDGNDEHRYSLNNLSDSFSHLAERLKNIEDLVYLQDNVVVINGVAILGTNAWWDYGFDMEVDIDQTIQWTADRYNITTKEAEHLATLAHQDARYLVASIQKLQRHQDVKKIVVVTHTVPMMDLVKFDPELVDTYRINTTGNSMITSCLDVDSENKISTWCFGHYHNDIDVLQKNVRWVNNPRGRGDTKWKKVVYFPKRIEIVV